MACVNRHKEIIQLSLEMIINVNITLLISNITDKTSWISLSACTWVNDDSVSKSTSTLHL